MTDDVSDVGPKLIGRQCVVGVLNYDHPSNIDGTRNAMHASLYTRERTRLIGLMFMTVQSKRWFQGLVR